jgi:hypothetical protein
MPVQCSSTVREGVMRPTTEEFEQYLPAFLVSNPVPKCAKGGHAAYAQVTQKINYSAVVIILRSSAQSCPPWNSIVRQSNQVRMSNYLLASTVVLNTFSVDRHAGKYSDHCKFKTACLDVWSWNGEVITDHTLLNEPRHMQALTETFKSRRYS